MIVAVQPAARPARRAIDFSVPLFAGFAVFLCVLILLPMFWLVRFALTDAEGRPTLANFATMITDPDLVDPLIVTMIISISVGVICCLVAAPMGWIVARTDMKARRVVR